MIDFSVALIAERKQISATMLQIQLERLPRNNAAIAQQGDQLYIDANGFEI